ncbi:uncharacterized protein LOC115624306 [Scaptodrosophila lebanonensis]|uniref:Uncharacterized protein LOC115624306 n=1 Tax=Drosophila lebanonensis TaxID=7225 RepID=A0A6J2TI42_DROLE|nr:uncharacterized protein LOC115624306 [Scaptodrosophila lebanonensis]
MCEVRWNLFIFLSPIMYLTLQGQTIPKDIQKCHFGNTKCTVDSMNAVIRNYPKGLPEIGMKPIDIVDAGFSQVWKNEQIGGTWFNFKLYDLIAYGYENTTITKVEGFGKNPTATRMEIHGQIPSLVHKGKYISYGRAWFIQLNGTGPSFSDFQNFRFTLKLKVIQEYRNNKRYLNIYELVPIIHMDRWNIWLDEFSPENIDLTIAVNKVFNDNWLEFWNELEPTVLPTLANTFTDLINNIFEKVSYDDMFIT